MSVRNKLILIISGFTLTISLLLLLVISKSVQQEVESSIKQNFAEQQQSLDQMQRLLYDRLIESALLIAQNPAFKANVALNDAPSIGQAIDEFADFIKADIIIVTDKNGVIVSSLNDVLQEGVSIIEYQGIESGLQGAFPDDEYADPALWFLEDQVIQLVTIPITTQFNVLGTLTVGSALTDHEAHLLQLTDNYDVHFIKGNQIEASTASEDLRLIIEQKVSNLSPDLKSESNHFIDQGSHFISISPIGESQEVFMVSSTDKDIALSVMDRIFSNLLWIALSALALILALGSLLGNSISKPITKINKAFTTVKNGDLNTRLNIESKDEFGQLSVAFNEMVGGLRERIKLQAYVGEHTRDMVSKATNDQSSTISATILFSDLRSFTRYTESNDPTKVVGMLNTWLGFQAVIIKKHQGAIDKFIGDEIMALFKGEDGIHRAIACAREIQAQAAKEKMLNPVPVGIGIGINSGEMILGNIGINDRHDFTVIGSNVNLASRLCSAAKEGEILITQEVMDQEKVSYSIDNVHPMGFKGFAHEIPIVRLKSDDPS